MIAETNVTVRIATIDDLAALCAVQTDIFDHAINTQRATEFLADPRHHLALAFVNDVIVGMASAVHYVHPDQEPLLFINEAGVASAFQQQGLGRELIQTLCAHGKSLGCTEAWVATEPSNIAAKRTYASVGGVEADEPFVMFNFNLNDEHNRGAID